MLSRKKIVFMETNTPPTFQKNFKSQEITKISQLQNFSTTEILQKHSTEKISGKQQTFSPVV